MARSFNGSQYCQWANSSNFDSDGIFTVSCWAYTVNVTAEAWAFGPASVASTACGMLGFRGDAANDPVMLYHRVGGTVGAPTKTSYLANTWHHLCGVSNSATNHLMYLDGVVGTTNTTNVGGISCTHMYAGSFIENNTRSTYLNGRVMQCAAWDAALTAAEVASLAKGFSPSRIRPQSLIFYDPCIKVMRSITGRVGTLTDNAGYTDQHRSYGL